LGIHAFTDEYGDSSLATEKAGVTTFFIVTAVLVEDRLLAEQRAQAEAIRAQFFGPGEMKSSAIGSDDARRRRVLEQVSELRVTTYSLAIDKRELDQEGGLAWRPSFFKFINRRLYDRIYRVFDDVRLVADEYGREAFMKGFVKYVDGKLPLNLFTRRAFGFASSADEVMLQVADIVSGCWARVLDPKKASPNVAELISLLQRRSVGVEVWPPRLQPEDASLGPENNARDEVVRRHCLRQAQLFLREHQSDASDDDLMVQIEILNMLLFNVRFGEASRYVATGKILDRIRTQLDISMSQRKLRGAISGMRDVGVVIGTSSKGYKLPVCERDIKQYVNHANIIVPPMLARLKRARDDLTLASGGIIDILDRAEFDELRRLVQAMNTGSV
jgi:hypothetical protein